MKLVYLPIIAILALLVNGSVYAETEQSKLDNELFVSVVERDYQKFVEKLEQGANPNARTDGKHYMSSALCEATKPDNEEYLRAIAATVPNMKFIHSTVLTQSQANCAIAYRNIAALDIFIGMGLDVSVVVNPEVPEISQRTLLDVAFNGGNMDLVWLIMQHEEPNSVQIEILLRSVEHSGGVEGHRYVPAIKNIVAWLRQQGLEVNPMPVRPATRK